MVEQLADDLGLCAGDRARLREGDRVALLVPASPGLPRRRARAARARRRPDPARPAAHRRTSASGSWPASPRPCVVDRRGRPGRARDVPDDPRPAPRPGRCTARAAPPARPRACGAGCSPTADAAALVAEERDLWGFARRRRQPRAQPALPLRAAAVRDGHAAGRRPRRAPRTVRPGDGHRGDRRASGRRRCSACRPTCSGCSRTGTRPGRPDLSSFRLVAHAGAPCPDARQAPAGRAVPRRVDLGVLRLDRGPVHGLPLRGVAGASRHRRPGPPGPGADRRRRRHDLVRGPAARPVQLLRRPGQDRGRLAGHPGRAGVHGRRPRPARRRRLPVPRRPPRGPGHQRRRQRLPARGRAGARASTPASTTSRCTASRTTEWGQRVCAAVVGPASPGGARRVRPRTAGPAQATQDLAGLDELPRTLTGKVLRQELPTD